MRSIGEGHIVITCDKGVNQATHPYLSPVGTFDVVQNMRIRGAGVLEKRPGSRAIGGATLDDVNPALTSPGSTDRPSFVATCGMVGVVGITSGDIFAHEDESDCLVPQGRFSTCQPVRRRSSLTGGQTGASGGGALGTNPTSVAVLTGVASAYVMVATIDDAENLLAFIETPLGNRVFTKKVGSTNCQKVRCLAQGSTFVLVWTQGTSLKAQTFQVAAADITIGTETTIATVTAGTPLDVAAVSATRWAAVYVTSGDLTLRLLNGVASVDAETVEATDTIGGACSVYGGSNGYCWVGWVTNGGANRYAIFDASSGSSLTPVLASSTINTGGGISPPLFGSGPSATESYAIYRTTPGGVGPDAETYKIHRVRLDSAGNVSNAGAYQSAFPISKPDSQGRFWALTANAGSTSVAFARVMLLRPVNGWTTSNGLLGGLVIELVTDEFPFLEPNEPDLTALDYFSAIAEGDDSHIFAVPFTLATFGDETLRRVDVLEYSTTETEPGRVTFPIGAGLAVAGQPCELNVRPLGQANLDGAVVDRQNAEGSAEFGIASAPSITVSGGGGAGDVAVGTYVYQAFYEWIDATGKRHQSPPSGPVSYTQTSAGAVTIQGTTFNLTARFTLYDAVQAPYLVVYRTVAGGTEPHRLPATSTDLLGFTVVDTYSDAAIADEEFIYTAGNVLPNVLAPSCRFVRLAAGRLWLGGLWNADQIECSKLIVPDEQTAFTGDASHRVSVGADVTGLASIDDQLVIFTEDAIFTVTGEGPNDQGIGSFVSRSVSLGVGCIDERSIAETDLGVLFRSRLGWHLLPRGLGPPQYIGAGIQDTARDFPSTLGAAVWHGNDSHLARFLVQNEAGDATRVLSFELTTGQWFIDTHARAMAEIGVWPSGFVLAEASFDTAVTSNPLWIEDPDEVADAVRTGFTGEHIEQRLRTNWFAPAGPGNQATLKQAIFQMVSETTSSITVQVETDVDTATPHSRPWALSASPGVACRYLVPPRRHGTWFRLSIWDAVSSGEPTAGVKLVGFTVESDADRGIRLPDAGEVA
jgi:hypothetical protein